MKYVWLVCALAGLLTGCGVQDTVETVADEPAAQVAAIPREISVQLPQEAAVPTLTGDSQQIYLCDGYEIILENHVSGDLSRSIRAVSGFEREDLTVLQRTQGDAKRYEFVWASAGEEGERLGRAVILDDGSFHYCLSVLRDPGAEQTDWDALFSSFCLT